MANTRPLILGQLLHGGLARFYETVRAGQEFALKLFDRGERVGADQPIDLAGVEAFGLEQFLDDRAVPK